MREQIKRKDASDKVKKNNPRLTQLGGSQKEEAS